MGLSGPLIGRRQASNDGLKAQTSGGGQLETPKKKFFGAALRYFFNQKLVWFTFLKCSFTNLKKETNI